MGVNAVKSLINEARQETAAISRHEHPQRLITSFCYKAASLTVGTTVTPDTPVSTTSPQHDHLHNNNFCPAISHI